MLAGPPELPLGTDIRLTLPARAENVAIVRTVVGALTEAVGLQSALIEDVKLAVTEACTNVVRHAYRGHDGPIDVSVSPQADCLVVVVVDRGEGIRPHPGDQGPGLGLPLMAALSDLEIDHGPKRGSRVTLSFPTSDDALEPA